MLESLKIVKIMERGNMVEADDGIFVRWNVKNDKLRNFERKCFSRWHWCRSPRYVSKLLPCLKT